ncbi:assimilatory sulfite reductase (NADPH) flavoprotein subunit [Shewanella submarina]|uniref:Sulfite reductase [NADPH] flavoprotein alpha-component n=1 Tax=Shewanella submarina TaxID=2016376 RepID=A0ABV7GA81_9GAMM|nr:assimilatory sulfite reductase (NADPH) flavoprotein subunit [Shewanella submarina]MCL1037351.1 assimilatory sulfite reductase (NADPH) flavoprotein subunit [Shewanella submarina]
MSLKELSQFSALLSAPQLDQLTRLTADMSPLQLAWVSGYLAASASEPGQSQAQSGEQAQQLTVLYGSQTGNSRGVAEALAQRAAEAGWQVNLTSMGDLKPKQIKDESLLALVVSTHGEGEAPDDAIELHQFLASKRAPKLDGLKYSVLALGDSSYEFFCQTGKDFDERLANLGAEALLPRVDCDVDFEDAAEQWQVQLLEALAPHQQARAQTHTSAVVGGFSVSDYSKQKPYSAELLVSQKITGRDSDKDIRHVEIDLGESGLNYQPGDALGVWFSNHGALVEELVSLLKLDGDAQVSIKDQTLSLQQALLEKRELTQLSPAQVQAWAELSGDAELQAIASDKDALRGFIHRHQLADLAKRWPVSVEPQQLVDLLRPITPRLYSIASSQAEVDEEVHLTVALVADEHYGDTRFGGASHFLAAAEEGQTVRVYVEPNKHFRLPDNPETPVVMIGPGTGVAPFRAFMQQREADGINGNAWLFFGNPHFEQDFLYQTEWQQYLKSGVLERLDVAFSRDQAHKVYVQHRIKEQGEALWQWLERGAHLYICGDADRMAKDVHQALLDVIADHGGKTREQAEAYLESLRADRRYQKDVY